MPITDPFKKAGVAVAEKPRDVARLLSERLGKKSISIRGKSEE